MLTSRGWWFLLVVLLLLANAVVAPYVLSARWPVREPWAPFSVGHRGLAALIAEIIVLDFTVRGLHITNQSQIYRLLPEARSRVTSAYMSLYFAGGVAVSRDGRWVAAGGHSGASRRRAAPTNRKPVERKPPPTPLSNRAKAARFFPRAAPIQQKRREREEAMQQRVKLTVKFAAIALASASALALGTLIGCFCPLLPEPQHRSHLPDGDQDEKRARPTGDCRARVVECKRHAKRGNQQDAERGKAVSTVGTDRVGRYHHAR